MGKVEFSSKFNKHKIIINVIVVLIVTLFAVYYLTKRDIITTESIKQVKWWNYLIVLGYVFIGFALLSLVDFLIYRTFTLSMDYKKCFVNTISGNLGSGITPLKSGHFPLMCWYQYNAGVPIHDTATGLVKCQIIYSATSIFLYTIVVAVLAIGGYTLEFYGKTVRLWLVVSLGLIFHIAVFTVIIILTFSPKIQKWVLGLWSKLLLGLKKIENVDCYIEEKAQKLAVFRQQISIIGKNFYIYIAPITLYALFMFASGSVQYLSYLLISGNAFSISSFFAFYTLNLASAYITNIIPVPGGVGTAEVLFSLIFISVISDSLIGSVLILWRVGSYYLCMIIELTIFVVFLFWGKGRKHDLGQN